MPNIMWWLLKNYFELLTSIRRGLASWNRHAYDQEYNTLTRKELRAKKEISKRNKDNNKIEHFERLCKMSCHINNYVINMY